MNAQCETLKVEPKRYACFGRVYRVEKAVTGAWIAAGRARGVSASWLDRLGARPTREAMQATLDCWARSRGLRPVGSSLVH